MLISSIDLEILGFKKKWEDPDNFEVKTIVTNDYTH